MAFTIPVLPMTSAFAGAQVLEIPQATSVPVTPSSSTSTYGSAPDSYGTAPDSYPDPTSGSTNPANPPPTVASNSESYPPGPNLGSISDYQNQQGENARPAGIAFGGGTRRHEPQSSMTTNLIVGGLIVGLVALEMASHHRHHR